MFRAVVLCLAAGVISFAAGPSSAQTAPPRRLDLSRLSDVQLSDRLGFIEQRLDRERNGAAWWQWGWAGFHAGSVVYSGVTIATSDNRNDRRTAIVNGIQAAGATLYETIWQHPAWRGADPIREMPASTRTEREAQLAEAEERLRDSSRRSEAPYRVLPHAISLGVNLIAGGIIWGIADRAHALRSTAAGIAIGEGEIWTNPSYGAVDFADYHSRFGGPAALHTSGAPPIGIAMSVKF